MLNIEIKELKINDKLKRKIEMIGRFTNTNPIINNGSIKNIASTNVAYVMPHIIVIKNNKYLMFDECDDVYVNTFKSKISFKDLEDYIIIISRYFHFPPPYFNYLIVFHNLTTPNWGVWYNKTKEVLLWQ